MNTTSSKEWKNMVSQTGPRGWSDLILATGQSILEMGEKRDKGPNENFGATNRYLGPNLWNLAPKGPTWQPCHWIYKPVWSGYRGKRTHDCFFIPFFITRAGNKSIYLSSFCKKRHASLISSIRNRVSKRNFTRPHEDSYRAPKFSSSFRNLYGLFAVIAWLESISRFDSSDDFWWLGLNSIHVEKNSDSTRVESCFSKNDSTQVTVNDSRLEWESFLFTPVRVILVISNYDEYINYLSKISTLCDDTDSPNVFIVGDFNACPKNIFGELLSQFCLEHELKISDKIILPVDSFTNVSDTHGTCSWLDHVVSSKSAHDSIQNIEILH